jgi:hypothetical protein
MCHFISNFVSRRERFCYEKSVNKEVTDSILNTYMNYRTLPEIIC